MSKYTQNKSLYIYIIIVPIIYSLFFPITIYRLFTLDGTVIQLYLTILFLIDFLFVLSNFKFIKINAIESILLLLIVPSCLIGIYRHEFDRRWITDFFIPVSFLLKISIFRNLYVQFNDDAFIIFFFRRCYIYTLISSFLGVIVYYTITTFFDISTYSGLEPSIYPSLINIIIKNNSISLLIILFLIIYTGKRSLLITALIGTIYSAKYMNFSILRLLLYVFIISIPVLLYSSIEIEDNKTFDKYYQTITLFSSDGNVEDIDDVGGGRFDEITTITNEMSSYDYFFGMGIGYTYVTGNRDIDQEYVRVANAHFTPLGIISKYGVIFYILFMFYYLTLFYTTWVFRKKDFLIKYCNLFLLFMLIDSLFSYSLFSNPILPICLAVASNFIKFKFNYPHVSEKNN